MATIGEIFRFIAIVIEAFGKAVARQYSRIAARLLGRDQLVAGSERKFRALLECAPDAMVIMDWHGHIKLVNAQAEALFGFSHDEIVGQTTVDLIPERLRASHRSQLKEYMRDPSPRQMRAELDLFALRPDGSEFPVEISLGQLQTDQGLLVSSAIRDISERKRSEAALREAEERFRTAFEEAPVGMALAALDGRLLQVNRSMREITVSLGSSSKPPPSSRSPTPTTAPRTARTWSGSSPASSRATAPSAATYTPAATP